MIRTFLDTAVFCFSIAAIIAFIVGHKDAPVLAVFTITAIVLRLADYIGERLAKRG